jgi:hypothetical protein
MKKINKDMLENQQTQNMPAGDVYTGELKDASTREESSESQAQNEGDRMEGVAEIDDSGWLCP